MPHRGNVIWDQRVTSIAGIGPKRAQLLEEMGIRTIADLGLNLPRRYIDASVITPIAHLLPNQVVSLHAKVVSARLIRTRSRKEIVTATLTDDSGQIKISFFHQPYIIKKLSEGANLALTGKTTIYQNKLTLINPTVESLSTEETIHTGRIIPIYRQHETLKTAWLRQTLFHILKSALVEVKDPLPPEILEQEQLMGFAESIWQAHFPDSLESARTARRRLAFTELWDVFLELHQQDEANRLQAAAARLTKQYLTNHFQQFIAASPFPLTKSQQVACQNLNQLLSQSHPGFHLVEGEVGSGKTLVAAYALTALARAGHQALYLAPTTILAQQHLAAIAPFTTKLGLSASLWIAGNQTNRHSPILVGTHALLHQSNQLQPAVVIIDEEHRFGVRQRSIFWEKDTKPHLISMTATPIPRTLAHALYGNHSTSHLQPIPGKEKQITTRVFPPNKLDDHLHWLGSQANANQSAFLVAPFINPSEAEGLAEVYDATTLFQRVKEILPELKVALLTGETTAQKREKLLEQLRQGKLNILVATPVIEVGIDIPQANIITILSAERFGLAALHQLRGRVGRSGQASWCFLVPSPGANNLDRLKKLETLSDGSQLAELDLQTRGVGEFIGTRQSGWDGLRTADWLDLNLIDQVKRVQRQVLDGMIQSTS